MKFKKMEIKMWSLTNTMRIFSNHMTRIRDKTFITLPNTLKPLQLNADFVEHIGDADSVLEVGCGTGCISILYVDRCKRVTGVDISGEAITNSKINLILNDYDVGKVAFVQSDLFENVGDEKFDVIVCNPPWSRLIWVRQNICLEAQRISWTGYSWNSPTT